MILLVLFVFEILIQSYLIASSYIKLIIATILYASFHIKIQKCLQRGNESEPL